MGQFPGSEIAFECSPGFIPTTSILTDDYVSSLDEVIEKPLLTMRCTLHKHRIRPAVVRTVDVSPQDGPVPHGNRHVALDYYLYFFRIRTGDEAREKY